MRFSSTNLSGKSVSLEEAVNHCVANDGGLFMPEILPRIPKAFFNNIAEMSLKDIAFVVATSFFGNDIEATELKNITDESFAYDAPFKKVGDCYILELFHGPTMTFKDYGARFMARIMRYLDRKTGGSRNILVATTGNTGAATANGFYKIPGINVLVLYPKGKLDRVQTSQITSLGENIYPVEVAGSIEDCKKLVRLALSDPTLSSYRLTGANSINVARFIPQITFALYAYSRLKVMDVPGAENALHIMPTGNMGNAIASVMAKLLGCPMGHVIAATGANNQVAAILGNAETLKTPLRTLAPAIDMSTPSGWPRIQYLFRNKQAALASCLETTSPISDAEITDTVLFLHRKYGYNMDTHGAVAYAAANQIKDDKVAKVVYATGHPAKQTETIRKIIGSKLELPEQLMCFMKVRRSATVISPTLPALKKFLTSIP